MLLNDYHALGKRIVYSVMRASGFELFDYGRMDVRPGGGARADRPHPRADDFGADAALGAQGARGMCPAESADSGIRVLVGGAPFLFDAQLWREVGADATAAPPTP